MNDAIVPVPSLAAQGQPAFSDVEAGAPGNQLFDPPRGLADHALHDRRIAQRTAGLERIGDMVVETVFRIDHARDAALRVGAVGDLQPILGDDQDGKPRVGAQGGANPGQPPADDKHVGKIVGNPLGTERNEVAWRGVLHSGGRLA